MGGRGRCVRSLLHQSIPTHPHCPSGLPRTLRPCGAVALGWRARYSAASARNASTAGACSARSRTDSLEPTAGSREGSWPAALAATAMSSSCVAAPASCVSGPTCKGGRVGEVGTGRGGRGQEGGRGGGGVVHRGVLGWGWQVGIAQRQRAQCGRFGRLAAQRAGTLCAQQVISPGHGTSEGRWQAESLPMPTCMRALRRHFHCQSLGPPVPMPCICAALQPCSHVRT